ncbi:MAG: septum formation initiator family protein [Muribaculaceae bacterium]|nr:septum formation initiator family protein [Muribaculaceae bacterium]
MALFKLQRPKWIPRWVNFPLLIFIAFVVVLVFFGENSFVRSSKYRKQINELKSQIKNYEDSASAYEVKVNELNTDNESLERLVREKYGMKRVNEEVYITEIP